MPLGFTGDPDPDVTWYKDGKQLKPRKWDRRVKIDWDMKTDMQTLQIRDATEDDAGDYMVKATNDNGSTSMTVNVCVGKDTSRVVKYEKRSVQSSGDSSASMFDDPMFSSFGDRSSSRSSRSSKFSSSRFSSKFS